MAEVSTAAADLPACDKIQRHLSCDMKGWSRHPEGLPGKRTVRAGKAYASPGWAGEGWLRDAAMPLAETCSGPRHLGTALAEGSQEKI